MHIWRENMNNKSNGQDFDRYEVAEARVETS